MKIEKLENYLLCLLIIIQPILELYFFSVDEGIQILGFNIPTIVRLSLFGLLCFFCLFKLKELRYKKWFILYIVVSFIYLLLHILSNQTFSSYVPGNFNYSIIEEIFYFIRMLIPMFLLYIVLTSKLTFNKFLKAIYMTTLIICFIIIITNIFKISFSAYLDEPIKGNIIDWFINKDLYGYLFTSSRGFFNNIIITYLLLLFLPIIYYDYLKNSKLFKYIVILMIMITLFMVGTKSTSYGFAIIAICEFILYLFALIKKEVKYNRRVMISLIFVIVAFFMFHNYLPAQQRMMVDKAIEEKKSEIIENNHSKTFTIKKDKKVGKKLKDINKPLSLEEALQLAETEEEKKEVKIEYLDNYYSQLGFSLYLINNAYPYKYDPDFWINTVNNTQLFERSNNRFIVNNIYKRIFDVNNNKEELFLGIGFSRTSKMYTLERDFLYQYYSLGLLGLITLLGPYVFLVIFAGLIMLFKFKKKCTLKNLSFMLSIGFMLVIAYYSGNTIENLGITMPLGIICGFFLKEIIREEDKNESRN